MLCWLVLTLGHQSRFSTERRRDGTDWDTSIELLAKLILQHYHASSSLHYSLDGAIVLVGLMLGILRS